MVKVAGHTHIGKRNNNEDNYFIADNFAIVADGMGGHNKGEVASEMAVECIRSQLATLSCISEKDVINAINSANLSIYNKASENNHMQDMGTTIVMCAWHDNDVVVANVGDSRCYLFSEESCKQITVDHSYVQSLIDSGKITELEAEKRNDKNIILRAVGCEEKVETDTFKISVKTGDKILLCSDGLSGALSTDEMKTIIFGCNDADDVTNKLVDKAYENGGVDNITAVVIFFC